VAKGSGAAASSELILDYRPVANGGKAGSGSQLMQLIRAWQRFEVLFVEKVPPATWCTQVLLTDKNKHSLTLLKGEW
jgi:hypothetical protein